MKQTKSTNVKNYYGAANTCDGFYSLFAEIFSPETIKTIYILKGGPGCGKSTMMKKISDHAVKEGYSVENFYCSSDPDSFDGVIIKELSVAVLDGTSPHTLDPKYPAVCENIINLGVAWDTEKALSIGKDVRTLSKQKKKAYDKAYAYLSSCHGALSVIERCMQSYLLEDKMCRAIERLASRIKFKSGKGDIRCLFTDCVSSKGNIHLDTFEKHSETRYFIKDFAGIMPKYMEFLANELTSRGADITLARDPVNTRYIRGIYIADSDISFTVYDDEFARKLDLKQQPYKIINMARFCDTDIYRCQKSIVRYAEKAYDTLYNGAIRELQAASQLHSDIEKLYYTVTDYSVVEKITEELIHKLFR